MKILHTADWHLGHRLLEHSQFEEQSRFLDWLTSYIVREGIDVLLISGDVFDTGSPSNQSLQLYYRFLVNLQETSCKHVVITGGNHDAPSTLDAPKDLLELFSIKVVGKAGDEVADEVMEIALGDERIVVAAVPYLRDQDIRKAVGGESFEEISDRYKTALVKHYSSVADYCQKISETKVPLIAMGHLFAIGGTCSDSEKTIYVGSLGDIGADDFPEVFDYIALGHLHRSQQVGKNAHIRYSGSPYILSFSEIAYEKKVVLIKTANNQISELEEVVVPRFRDVSRISGTPEACIQQLLEKDKEVHELQAWVEIVVDKNEADAGVMSDLNKTADMVNVGVLKIRFRKEQEQKGLEQLVSEYADVKELMPLDVFKMKCEQEDFNLNENPEILDAYNEILQIAQDQDTK